MKSNILILANKLNVQIEFVKGKIKEFESFNITSDYYELIPNSGNRIYLRLKNRTTHDKRIEKATHKNLKTFVNLQINSLKEELTKLEKAFDKL